MVYILSQGLSLFLIFFSFDYTARLPGLNQFSQDRKENLLDIILFVAIAKGSQTSGLQASLAKGHNVYNAGKFRDYDFFGHTGNNERRL